MRNCKRINTTIHRDTLKKIIMMEQEADRLYPGKNHTFNDVVTALVNDQFKDPMVLILECKEKKRQLALQMNALDKQIEEYASQIK